MEKRLMTVEEVSDYLALPRATVYSFVARKRFPEGTVRRLGRALRFEKAAIDGWLAAQDDKRPASV